MIESSPLRYTLCATTVSQEGTFSINTSLYRPVIPLPCTSPTRDHKLLKNIEMSVSRDTPRTGPFAFSDQITSRLHRWVERTTAKARVEEKAQCFKLTNRRRSRANENDLNIKKGESFPRNADTRTILELEKALKDLINNCVTNNLVNVKLTSGEAKTSFLGEQINTAKTVVNINHNIDEVGSNGRERVGDKVTGVDHQTKPGEYEKNFEKLVSSSEGENTRKNDFLYKTATVLHSEALPHLEEENAKIERHESSKSTSRNKPNKSHPAKSVFKGEEQVFSSLSQANQEKRKVSKKVDENLHHSSTSAGTTPINTPAPNTNNGLNTGSSIKKQLRRISKSGWNALHLNKTKTAEANGNVRKKEGEKERPQLRRILSEGDAISKTLSFKDRDVSEFAETCIRHAQRKQSLGASSLESDVDPFGEIAFGEAERNLKILRSPECGVSREHRGYSEVNDVGIGSDCHADLRETSTSVRIDTEAMLEEQHRTLSGRPSSLSFPLEKSRMQNIKKETAFRQKTFSDGSDSPSSPLLTDHSPKFKKFPCQPVFYVPQQTDKATRTMLARHRSKSLVESEHGYSEYLI